MDPTRAFLLNEMANATSLEVFFLAFRALDNLNRLAQQRGLNQNVPTPRAPQGPATPQGPQFSSEPSWPDEQPEKFPWENQ